MRPGEASRANAKVRQKKRPGLREGSRHPARRPRAPRLPQLGYARRQPLVHVPAGDAVRVPHAVLHVPVGVRDLPVGRGRHRARGLGGAGAPARHAAAAAVPHLWSADHRRQMGGGPGHARRQHARLRRPGAVRPGVAHRRERGALGVVRGGALHPVHRHAAAPVADARAIVAAGRAGTAAVLHTRAARHVPRPGRHLLRVLPGRRPRGACRGALARRSSTAGWWRRSRCS